MAVEAKEISTGDGNQDTALELKNSIVQMEQKDPQDTEKLALHAQLGDDETARYATESIEIDAATNKRLFWKINRRILIVMLITYFCQSLDKGTLGFSSIMGIQKDANLVGQDVSSKAASGAARMLNLILQYSWLGTILYMGILAGEYPTNFLLQKLPVAKYLAAKYELPFRS